MLVDPFKMVNGLEDSVKSNGYSVPVNAETIRGYQGNPWVATSENTLERETYEMQKMIDPGDSEKKREIYHMFPGTYEFTSNVYANIPADSIGILVANDRVFNSGSSVVLKILKPGYKGLITGQLVVNGGEAFFEPGEDIAELIVMKVGK